MIHYIVFCPVYTSHIHKHTALSAVSENQKADLKPYLMKIKESFKEHINNSLKEIQENMGKQVEALKEETNKSLKEIQENTIKRGKELNKAV